MVEDTPSIPLGHYCGVKELTREPPSTNGTSPPARSRARAKHLYWIAAALVLVAALGIAYVLRPKAGPAIATVPLVRKTLIADVTATGTVNPQDTINVGTQVSGTIQLINADYNDHVHKGQILARLDPTLFQASLDQARGSLAQAQAQWQAAIANTQSASSTTAAAYANAQAAAGSVRVAQGSVTSADTNVEKARAALTLAEQTLARDRQLLAAGYIAQSQYDIDYSNHVAATSALNSAIVAASQARIQLAVARSQSTAGSAQGKASASQESALGNTAAANLAAIASAQAQVKEAIVNLGHTVITSPVDGTVIARNVSIGQTVAASFQTPTLYTIAKDLTKMEIDLAVGEPDIGSVRVGQSVDFTVLAFPSYTFHGKVAQVRENPTTLQNVVTYDTVVYENNTDGRLRPGMTASASIKVAHADNALVVPLAALSFHTAAQQPRVRASATPRGTPASTSWGNTGAAQNVTLAAGSVAQVTLVDHGNLLAVPVRIMLVSGGEAAIEPVGQTLAPGSQIAVSAATRQTQTPARAPGLLR